MTSAHKTLSVILLGLLLVSIAAVIWETSEQLCPLPGWHWLQYLRLHSLWHLAVGYGVYLLLQVGMDRALFPPNYRPAHPPTQHPQATALLSAPGLYHQFAMFDNRHSRYRWVNTFFPRVVYLGCACQQQEEKE